MRGFRVSIFPAVMFLCIGVSTGAKLPPTFQICDHRSNEFNACVGNAIEGALRDLKKGYPPLGIYSVDPLLVTSIDIQQGTGPVSINLKFTDLNIHGFGDASITDFKYVDYRDTRIRVQFLKGSSPSSRDDIKVSDLDNLTFGAVMSTTELRLEGNYSMDGKVLLLPIKGAGRCSLQLERNGGPFLLKGEEFMKNGLKYMKATDLTFSFDTKKLTMHFENLFSGNEAVGNQLNKFMNENSLEILRELKPSIQETFGIAFKDITNRLFTKVPFYEIFPGLDKKTI